MSKPPLRLSQAGPDLANLWQRTGKRGFSYSLTLLLIMLAWALTARPPGSPSILVIWGIGLLTITVALTLALERALSSSQFARTWRFRLAFLGSGSCLVLLLVVYRAGWGWIGGVVLASVLGGLLASTLEGGLWENNSPPSVEVSCAVYQRHLEIIGNPDPGKVAQRAFDLLLAVTGLVLSLPVWTLSAFLIWLEDPGPVLFIKNSVGKGGLNFRQFKFRTMVRGAEDSTGPVRSSEEDRRVLAIGRILRKTALDELPQLLNILLGEMSFVGPRPQRTVLVQGYLEEMPEYAERHRVAPGLSGLAQVAGDYYLTPRQKLRLDRLYIRHAGLGFDLKLILLAFLITFWYRWRKDWNGRLPRRLLRFGS
jgi:lipopolysaccharide/colanic/teichoic acid biosynthesis glycosyltransferase